MASVEIINFFFCSTKQLKSIGITRKKNPKYLRTSILKVTASGEEIIYKVQDLVIQNRRNAQAGISIEDLENLNRTLQKIIINCQSKLTLYTMLKIIYFVTLLFIASVKFIFSLIESLWR